MCTLRVPEGITGFQPLFQCSYTLASFKLSYSCTQPLCLNRFAAVLEYFLQHIKDCNFRLQFQVSVLRNT